ncbi:MAG: dTMP kinase [Pirellulales bacterium]|nr:dTMP kinase [Pirellulales bacterium]
MLARFLTLEGIDGSGKSSQLVRLADWLRSLGVDVVTCRDPGATAAGDAVRNILLHRQEIPLAATAEMFLYMAARAQLVEEVIRPALARGAWVVSDRFLLSNVVYQGRAGGLGAEKVWRIGETATGGLEPDLVLWLDIDLATAAQRMQRELDRLESRGDAFRQLLRDGYQAEATANPARVCRVDATVSQAQVAERLQQVVREAFTDLPAAAGRTASPDQEW